MGGIPNVIKTDQNGILSKDSSLDEYYKAVKRYLSLSEQQLNLIKQNCLDSIDEYKISTVAEKYINAYLNPLG